MPLIHREILGEPVKLFVLPPSTGERRAHFGGRWKQFTESDDIFGLDVESTAIDEDRGVWEPSMRLRAIQFGTRTQGWMLDPHDPFWRARIIRLLNDPCKRFVSHTNYDPLWILREFGIDLGAADRSLDTFPMAALLRPGELNPKDLKTLSRLFIDNQLTEAEAALHARFYELAPKSERAGTTTKNGLKAGRRLKAWGFTHVPLDDPAFGLYGGFDAVYVRRLLDELNVRLRSAGMAKLSRREQRIERLMTGVQVRGHRLDADYTKARIDEVEGEYSVANERLWDTLGFTPGSPKVGPFLEGLGVNFTERTPSGRPKLDKTTLPYLAELNEGTPGGAVLADLLTISKLKNLRTNLATCYRAQDADGFVHPRILTQQAVTGRMSIRTPAMQTFKKGPLRGCFIARDGFVFVGADYDSQEIRLAAAFSGDPAYNRIVAEGLNQHDLTAELIFGPNWRDNPFNRKAAKILNFAQQYGAGPQKIAAQLGISFAEAKKLWLAWRKAYRGLVKWSENLARYKSVTNPWDRLIPADRWRPYANGNYAIQSSGRDMLGDAIVNLADAGYGTYLWLPIHDELILEVPEELAEQTVPILEQAMFTTVGSIEMTAKAEIIGHRWSGDTPEGKAA